MMALFYPGLMALLFVFITVHAARRQAWPAVGVSVVCAHIWLATAYIAYLLKGAL